MELSVAVGAETSRGAMAPPGSAAYFGVFLAGLIQLILICIASAAGLSDPWAANKQEEMEPLPSYDDITSGAIGDPWGPPSTTSIPPQQPSQPVPLTDPWPSVPPPTAAGMTQPLPSTEYVSQYNQ